MKPYQSQNFKYTSWQEQTIHIAQILTLKWGHPEADNIFNLSYVETAKEIQCKNIQREGQKGRILPDWIAEVDIEPVKEPIQPKDPIEDEMHIERQKRTLWM